MFMLFNRGVHKTKKTDPNRPETVCLIKKYVRFGL